MGIVTQARQLLQLFGRGHVASVGPNARNNWSLNDPHLVELFNLGPQNYANVNVSEYTALGLSAVYRAVSLISTTVASLPLRTLREVDGVRTEITSIMDSPGGPDGPTRFEWVETLIIHLLLHGNAFILHVRNGAGTLARLDLIHPLCVEVNWELDARRRRTGRKVFTVSLDDGRKLDLSQEQMTHVPALTLDGLKGVSPIWIARNSLGTAIAGDRAAAKLFATGALHSGIVTPEEDISDDDAKVIKKSLNAKVSGWENAGEIAVINRKLKFTPWTMSMEDAQFLQSRQFQIEEVARWFGVPPHLLMQTEKQTSWGTGVAEQNRGLSRYTLSSWTSRIEERLSRLLPAPRFVEFDYAGLLKPAPEQEIPLLIQQYQAGLITKNEYRRFRGMDPVEGGDEFATFAAPQQQPEAVPA